MRVVADDPDSGRLIIDHDTKPLPFAVGAAVNVLMPPELTDGTDKAMHCAPVVVWRLIWMFIWMVFSLHIIGLHIPVFLIVP